MQLIKWSEIDNSFCNGKEQVGIYVCKNCSGTLDEFANRTTQTHIVNSTFMGDSQNGLFRRMTANIEQTHFLFYDFDSGEDIPFLIKTFRRLNCAIVATTSKNHLVDKGDGKGCIPRLHLHLPIEPINGLGEITGKFMTYAWQNILEELQLDCADKNAKDAVRKFAPGRQTKVFDGPLLDIRRFKEPFKNKMEMERQERMMVEIGCVLHRNDKVNSHEFIEAYVRKHKLDFRVKHEHSYRMQQLCVLIGACKTVGADINELERWIDRNAVYNNEKGAAFTKRNVHKTIQKLWRKNQ